MSRRSIEQIWLAFLGGDRRYAGLAVAMVGLVLGLLGITMCFAASDRADESFVYSIGYWIVVIGTLTGIGGIIYHRVIFVKRDAKTNK